MNTDASLTEWGAVLVFLFGSGDVVSSGKPFTHQHSVASSSSLRSVTKVENWQIYFLNHQLLILGEKSLHRKVFKALCQRWGTSDVCLQDKRSAHNWRRRPSDTLGPFLSNLCLPTSSASSASVMQEIASYFTVAGFNRLAVAVIPMLLKARKPSSRKIYHRIWRPYGSWCEARKCHPYKYVIRCILAFLQSEVELNLALHTIKGQV